jgi:hypothetical protein
MGGSVCGQRSWQQVLLLLSVQQHASGWTTSTTNYHKRRTHRKRHHRHHHHHDHKRRHYQTPPPAHRTPSTHSLTHTFTRSQVATVQVGTGRRSTSEQTPGPRALRGAWLDGARTAPVSE